MNADPKTDGGALEKLAALLGLREQARQAMLDERYGARDELELETEEERFNRILNDPGAWEGEE